MLTIFSTLFGSHIHRSVTCSECLQFPLTGLCFQCATCTEYYMCSQCVKRKSSVHVEDHPFILVCPNENLESCSIIWFTSSGNQHADETTKRKTRLRSITNYSKIFEQIETCVNYISAAENDKIFFVLSGSLEEEIILRIYDLHQVVFFYIYSIDVEHHYHWSEKYLKSRGVFSDESTLFTKLRDDIKLLEKQFTAITVISSLDRREKSFQDSGEMSFLDSAGYDFRLCLRSIEKPNDQLDHCLKLSPGAKINRNLDCIRQQYYGNDAELSKVDQFEKKYRSEEALTWYTSDCFLYKILNKAFRIENNMMVHQLDFFIRDLTQQLADLQNKQYPNKNEVITVYRGQFLTLSEFQNIRDNEGGMISINSYFSTSESSEVALMFAGSGENWPFLQSVLFTIELHAGIDSKPFAKINRHSAMTDEKEVLISYGTIFEIQSVEKYDCFWNVNLVLSGKKPPWQLAIDELPHCCFESFFAPLIYGCGPTVNNENSDSNSVSSLLEEFRRGRIQERQIALQLKLKKVLGNNYGRTRIRRRGVFLNYPVHSVYN